MAQDTRISIGINSLKLGPIANDGSMGANLTAFPEIVSGTASFIQAPGTTATFTIETLIDPFYSFPTPGAKTVKYSVYNVSPEALLFLFGGAIVNTVDGQGNSVKTYNSNDFAIIKELSCQIATTNGPVINIPRLNVQATLTWNLDKTKLAQVDVTGTVLTPTKTGLSAFSLQYTIPNTSPAAISSQPVSQTGAVGSSKTFSVVSTNTTGYQWYKGSVAIAGATTPNYTIPSAQVADNGTYRVDVTGNDGVVLSSANATLTVS